MNLQSPAGRSQTKNHANANLADLRLRDDKIELFFSVLENR